MIPSLTYQIAQDRRAELLREAEDDRRVGLRSISSMSNRSRFPILRWGMRRSSTSRRTWRSLMARC